VTLAPRMRPALPRGISPLTPGARDRQNGVTPRRRDSVPNNIAMRIKIESGDAIDISGFAREGIYYIIPRHKFFKDCDYCDPVLDSWIWSIGRRKHDGVLLASIAPDLYYNPDFECVWLK